VYAGTPAVAGSRQRGRRFALQGQPAVHGIQKFARGDLLSRSEDRIRPPEARSGGTLRDVLHWPSRLHRLESPHVFCRSRC
jgi:hypothetical protein